MARRLAAASSRSRAVSLLSCDSVFLSGNVCCVGQVELPTGNLGDRIEVAADGGSHWVEGSYDVYLLRGNCYIHQGLTYARSREAVLWIERARRGEPPHKVIAWLEGDVTIDYQAAGEAAPRPGGHGKTLRQDLVRPFLLGASVDVRPMNLRRRRPRARNLQSRRGRACGTPSGTVKKAQFAEPITPPSPIVGPPPGMIRVRLQGRSAVECRRRDQHDQPSHERSRGDR